MTRPLMLDTGPLGEIIHPQQEPKIAIWLARQRKSKVEIIIPEIADYELRRNLLLEDLTESLQRLDELKKILAFLPINTEAMLTAAQLWAEARGRGRPTADPQALDGDVILAAQAQQRNAIVVTENVGHLSLFVDTENWREMLNV